MASQAYLKKKREPADVIISVAKTAQSLYQFHNVDAFEWLAKAPMNSIEAVVTDPPYGLVEVHGFGLYNHRR